MRLRLTVEDDSDNNNNGAVWPEADMIDTIPTQEFITKLKYLSEYCDVTIAQTILAYSEQYVLPIYDQTTLHREVLRVPFQLPIPGIEVTVYSRNIIRSLSKLRESKHICNLNLANKNISDADAEGLGMLLKENTTWVSVKLMENCLTCIGVTILAAVALQHHNHHLKNLHLSRNYIGNHGATVLGAILRHNDTLEILNLSSNIIGDEGSTEIGLGLQENCSLKELRLSFNLITDDGIKEIANSLKSNTKLQLLNLMTNNIGNTGCQQILRNITTNTSLLFLSLAYNPINRLTCDKVKQYMVHRKMTGNPNFKFIV